MEKVLSQLFSSNDIKMKKYIDIFREQQISLEIFVFNARQPSLKGIWLRGLEDMGIEKDDMMEIMIESAIQRKYYYIFINTHTRRRYFNNKNNNNKQTTLRSNTRAKWRSFTPSYRANKPPNWRSFARRCLTSIA